MLQEEIYALLKMPHSKNSAAQADAGGFLFEVFPGTKELGLRPILERSAYKMYLRRYNFHILTDVTMIHMDQLADLFTLVIS